MEKVSIGDIVAILGHPFSRASTEVVFAGDPLQQSPLMIVEEERPAQKDKTGDVKDVEGSAQYKCSWYSAKSQKFESAWFFGGQVKVVELFDGSVDTLPSIGSNVIFRTAKYEVHKKKAFMQYGSGDGRDNNFQINSLVSFVSPVLLVIGYIDAINQKNGKKGQRKEISKGSLIKVKWFNVPADKFTEAVIFPYCVEELPKVEDEILSYYKNAIDKREFIAVTANGQATVILPLLVFVLNGVFHLRFKNIFAGIQSSCQIDEIIIVKPLNELFSARAPEFDFGKSNKPLLTPLDLIKANPKKIIRIKFTNLQQVSSVRCVQDYALYEFDENGKSDHYLDGFCLLKGARRTFKMSNIEWVEVLAL